METVRRNRARWRNPGIVILGVAALGVAGAAGFWGRGWLQSDTPDSAVPAAVASLLSQQQLRGATASTGETFAMATGPIDSEVEGLYLLDFLTGELRCVVLNYRTAKFTSIFRANVFNDLGVDPAKKPKYLMTTGSIDFPRGATIARPGNSIVYVLETESGNYAAYAIPWRRELAATGRVQASPLLLLDVGTARTVAIRE